MAHGEGIGSRQQAGDAARRAGMRRDNVTLEDVDRRRAELWTVSLIVVAVVVVAVAIFSLGGSVLPEPWRLRGIPSWVLAVLVLGLTLAFLVYVYEKERSLRNLSKLLLEERVRAAELQSAYETEHDAVTRLKELDRLKDDFVATASHELRSPLTAIIGAAKSVSRKGPEMNPEHHAMFMDIISRQADRLMRLIEEVLTTSSLESGRTRMRRERIDLGKMTPTVIQDLATTKAGAGRRINLKLDPQNPQTWGDPVAIEQILSNLLENALKYSEDDVDLRVTETEAETAFEISDRGRGISAEQVAGIFDRFHRAESTEGSGAGGFGLGLFIVKNLVEAHNGKIEVTSELGRGTVFKVHFPKRAMSVEALPGKV